MPQRLLGDLHAASLAALRLRDFGRARELRGEITRLARENQRWIRRQARLRAREGGRVGTASLEQASGVLRGDGGKFVFRGHDLVVEPQELGGAAVFLASDAAAYVHGVVLPVDGGWLAR